MSCFTDKWEFYQGETKTLRMQLMTYNKSIDCKEPFTISSDVAKKISVEVPASPANLTLTLLTSPAVLVVSEPLGIIEINLTPTQTAEMICGTVIVTHDADGTGANVTIGQALKVICKKITSNGC